MSRRMKPDPGQQCECESHPSGEPSDRLQRVYRYKGRKPCYEWWCEDCYEETEPLEKEWPVREAVHCPVISGLD